MPDESNPVVVNPLTGLPGDVSLFKEVEGRLSRGDQFAVCYLDLDHFRVFNDRYGFKRGDEVIKMVNQVIGEVLQTLNIENSFLFHLGGDDFVLVTTPQVVDIICPKIIELFDRKIIEFYDGEDKQKGYLTSFDRKGNITQYSIMSISIVVVTNEKRKITHVGEVNQIADELKKYIKSFEGSKHLKDRRQEMGEIIAIKPFDRGWGSVWQELATVRAEQLGSQDLLFDKITELPTIPLVLKDLKKPLEEEKKQIGILYLNIIKYNRREGVYDWIAFDHIMKQLVVSLRSSQGSILRKEDLLATSKDEKEGQVIFLSPPRQETSVINKEVLEKITYRLHDYLREKLQENLGPVITQKFGIYLGYTFVNAKGDIPTEQIVAQGIKEAMQVAARQEQDERWQRINRFKEIIRNKEIEMRFQPIVYLADKRIFGYEALTRGPKGTNLEYPETLFSLAYELNLVKELEEICRNKIAQHASCFQPEQLIFVNVEPEIINDIKFRDMRWQDGLKQENIVLEISEQIAIDDFYLFKYALECFRVQGFKVAIDDVESSTESLSLIGELKPEYLKFNISMVEDIDKDIYKQQVLKGLLHFANEINAQVITEGVETMEEYQVLLNLGFTIGQGFFFALPQKLELKTT